MTAAGLRILMWHVHGSWTTAFLQGRHEYVLPVIEGRGPDGRGRARTWDWPDSAVERRPAQLREEPFDVVILQRPHELELTRQWTGRRPGVDVPAVYLEHNAPEPHPALSRHPQADSSLIPLVHVTHFNQLFWDSGRAPSTVIEHGVLDPGERYTGELPRAAVVINEPARRGRMVGADLLPGFAAVAPIDLFGMGDTALGPGIRLLGDVPQDRMHVELARRRLYLHTTRWTSLGLALVEAMMLGMPVVAVASTEIGAAVPCQAGVVSTDLAVLRDAIRTYTADPEAARLAGKAARHHALAHYGLDRFLTDWDGLLAGMMR
jgi:glycosyltransferase involved in cell wall biosynthesis